VSRGSEGNALVKGLWATRKGTPLSIGRQRKHLAIPSTLHPSPFLAFGDALDGSANKRAPGEADRLSGNYLSIPTANAGAGHTLGSIPLRILAAVENLPIQFVVLLAEPD
jgi:hypothetical protein